MGVRHSKPRTGRRRLKGRPTSERQSPEGDACPTAAPPTSLDKDRSPRLCNQACPCNKVRQEGTEEAEWAHREDYGNTKIPSAFSPNADGGNEAKIKTPSFRCLENAVDLRVNLPQKEQVLEAKSKFLERSSFSIERDPTDTEQGETEWTFSLENRLNHETGKSRDEELLRVMSSIRDALDSSIGQCSDGQNRVRVRLSVTPEPKARNRLRHDQSDFTPLLRHRSSSPNVTEKGNIRNHQTQDKSSCSPETNSGVVNEINATDRRHHYRQIPGVDSEESKPTPTSCTKCHKSDKRSNHSSRSRERHRVCTSKQHCCRDDRKHAHRYQSPFDQSFRETMYLRLRELQRDSAREERLARGWGSSAPSSSSESSSDSEYSGDDGCDDSAQASSQVSRIFEPLSKEAMQAITHSTERRIEVERSMSLKQRDSLSLTHHVHKHESMTSRDTTVTSRSNLSKPKSRESRSVDISSRRKFTKTRKKSSGNVSTLGKPHHGYLRANILPPGAMSAFPNTPQLSTALSQDTSGSVQRHQHEHIHHHYYYHSKSES
uniref:Uncharacterized protein LOC100175654 n=1 Tax=Phallusia mammillata TaxID=59560 RepID=A0A6F9DGZ4_9ASCI|nr:uncharacterized protein LOC100175654 [Phallusia mammillata]